MIMVLWIQYGLNGIGSQRCPKASGVGQHLLQLQQLVDLQQSIMRVVQCGSGKDAG